MSTIKETGIGKKDDFEDATDIIKGAAEYVGSMIELTPNDTLRCSIDGTECEIKITPRPDEEVEREQKRVFLHYGWTYPPTKKV